MRVSQRFGVSIPVLDRGFSRPEPLMGLFHADFFKNPPDSETAGIKCCFMKSLFFTLLIGVCITISAQTEIAPLETGVYLSELQLDKPLSGKETVEYDKCKISYFTEGQVNLYFEDYMIFEYFIIALKYNLYGVGRTDISQVYDVYNSQDFNFLKVTKYNSTKTYSGKTYNATFTFSYRVGEDDLYYTKFYVNY